MKKYTSVIILLLLSGLARAQNWEWLRGFNTIQAAAVTIDKDGNSYFLAAFRDSLNETDYFDFQADSVRFQLIKSDASGVLLWSKQFSCTGKAQLKIILKNDTAAYLTGTFSGTFHTPDFSTTSNGDRDILLVRLGSGGTFALAKHFGGAGDEHGECAFDRAGNLVVAGGYKNSGSFDSIFFPGKSTDDFFLLRYDPSGQLQWSERAISTDTTTGYYCYGYGILTDSSGNIYVQISGDGLLENNGTGVGELYGSNLYKFNSSGTLKQMFDIYQTFASSDCTGLDVDDEGNVYCFYTINPTHGNRSSHAVKYDSLGQVVWQKGYGYNTVAGPLLDGSGNYYFTSCSDPDSICAAPVIIKADAHTGNTISKLCIAHCGSVIAVGQDNALYLAGRFRDSLTLGPHSIYSSFGEYAPFLARLSGAPISVGPEPFTPGAFALYPNPSAGRFSLQFNDADTNGNVSVYDMLGNCICTKKISAADQTIDLSGNAKGIYFIEVQTANTRFNKKLILN